jgi:hypothetical protein
MMLDAFRERYLRIDMVLVYVDYLSPYRVILKAIDSEEWLVNPTHDPSQVDGFVLRFWITKGGSEG